LNYRHAYHAGNFADVHKHVTLLALLEHLHKKPTPLFVLDTHAGRGEYDLNSPEARRGNESHLGVGRVRSASLSDPLLQRYLALVDSKPYFYPGSPVIVASTLRESDRAVFVERHPEEANALQRTLGRRKRVSVLEEDGYGALRAQLPPKENRGVVLIDPPYEKETEFGDATKALLAAIKRWPNGVYCLWYPLKLGSLELRMYRAFADSGTKKILKSTLYVRPSDSPLGLNGSGLLIVNPPWQLDEHLRQLLTQLHRVLSPDGLGDSRVEWLVGE
jgi:23S rRNA (adenine2030-N6)-methyltransferase